MEALAAAVREDPNAYGLRATMVRAGGSLIDAVEGLGSGGGPVNLVVGSGWSGTPGEWFLYQFVSVVAGEGTTIADALARRSATACAERILADPATRGAIERQTSDWNFADSLFCEVYQLFFADYVAAFVRAVIAEKVKLVVPALVLVDPSGQIADWVADQVAAVLPMPCAEKEKQRDDPRSITEIARDMLQDTVSAALGLPGGIT
ncbi:hypothetical protein [Amycolatopsis albispora]|uniref:Uncharacterized protein n=1 Tax=Amycolatopsis albispora TaxID=1804986 RepID=A0A344L3S6_9PSEU|nr:hypothetical protein [Amycolatopsis albispora]AXB42700.1 hypothetical protein A4R43_09285 [Amycolatopsis albispora]